MALITMRPTEDGLSDLIKLLPSGITMAEIGSYRGESAAIFASSGKVKYIYCVDSWAQGYDITDDASSSDMGQVESDFDVVADNHRFVILKEKMSSNYASLLFHNLDFVYIDANHQYEAVLNDINDWLPNIKDGGYIGGHDYRIINGEKNSIALAVQDTIGEPDYVFSDSSWLKKI